MNTISISTDSKLITVQVNEIDMSLFDMLNSALSPWSDGAKPFGVVVTNSIYETDELTGDETVTPASVTGSWEFTDATVSPSIGLPIAKIQFVVQSVQAQYKSTLEEESFDTEEATEDAPFTVDEVDAEGGDDV